MLVHLSSKDVIHSFGLYEMRVKQDAIPGMSIPVWFIPNRIGDYEITCSQLCGLGHFRMRGFVTIQSAADYQKWMSTTSRRNCSRRATATHAQAAPSTLKAEGSRLQRPLRAVRYRTSAPADAALDGAPVREIGRRHVLDRHSQRS